MIPVEGQNRPRPHSAAPVKDPASLYCSKVASSSAAVTPIFSAADFTVPTSCNSTQSCPGDLDTLNFSIGGLEPGGFGGFDTPRKAQQLQPGLEPGLEPGLGGMIPPARWCKPSKQPALEDLT